VCTDETLTYNEQTLTFIPRINEEHFMNRYTMNNLHVAVTREMIYGNNTNTKNRKCFYKDI